MAFIVGDACVKCKLTDCVEVCPVDCFYEGPNMLVINPDECIDCALCEPECPIEAIYSEDEVPEDQIPYIELNAELCMEWPNIVEQKNPLPDSEEWRCFNKHTGDNRYADYTTVNGVNSFSHCSAVYY